MSSTAASATPTLTIAYFMPWQRINAAVHRVALAASQLDIAPEALHRAARMPFVRHHPGADPIGGMVEFATPQPVTSDNGADGWLMVHLAACFGQTAGTHQDRMAWVLGQEPLWRRISSDPLMATEWATPEIADPWSALAAAIEWARFLDVGYGMGSRLPVVLQARHLEGLMPDFSLPAPLTTADHDALSWVCGEAREAGVEAADGRVGAFGVHAANAWTVAHYLKTGIELARGVAYRPSCPPTRPDNAKPPNASGSQPSASPAERSPPPEQPYPYQEPTMGQSMPQSFANAITPMQAAITVHRRTLDAIEAAPPFDGDCEELVALDHAEWDALHAVIAAPCSNRADALAVLRHFRPYVAAQGNAFGGALRDLGEVTCAVAEAILRALAVALGEDAAEEGLCREPNGWPTCWRRPGNPPTSVKLGRVR